MFKQIVDKGLYLKLRDLGNFDLTLGDINWMPNMLHLDDLIN